MYNRAFCLKAMFLTIQHDKITARNSLSLPFTFQLAEKLTKILLKTWNWQD